jgi:lambda family phage tail tape measure protein
MATVATLETRMALNSTAFRQGMIQAANQANASLGSISKQAGATASVLLSLKRAANTFGSFYLVKEGLSSLIEAQKQLQAIQFTLMAATGSSTLAADAFQFVRDESQKLGLVLPTAAQGFANLSASATAAGVSLSDQKELFDAYARSSTTLHLSTEQSSRALLALEQMFAKGTIQAQELRLQLGQAIPGAAQRFQNAVMEMTKGTSLAGKSFDQLLAAGDLTTSKFLPALVKALQESGRGVEQAAQGLQANLNRVQTAWFNLKTEVSGGLFNDAATAGAGLLADNLSRIAGLVTLIGAGGLAKISGGALDSGASKVARLQQEYKGAQMAAAAEVKYASAIEATAAANLQRAEAAALENQVVKDAAASALADAKAREIEAFGIKEAALAEMQRVEAAAALNESMAAGTVAKRTSAELDVRLAATSKALTAAEAQLTASLVTQAAARDTLALAEGRQAALRGGVLEASAAATAAAATAAEVRAAEVALGGFAAAAGRAAKSFGAFAMGLVGGPWGLAVAAIGAVGYAIYKVNANWDEYLKHADEVAKSNEEVTQTLKDMAAAYTDVATRPDAGALSAGLDSAGKAAADARKELDDLIAKRDALGKLSTPGLVSLPGVDSAASSAIGELDAKIAHARGTLDDLTAASSKTQQELAAELAPAVVNSVGPALDLLATRVYGAKDAFAALQGLASIPSSFGDLVAQATDASKAFKAYSAESEAAAAASLKSIQKHGKSNEGLAQVRLDLLKNSAAWKNMTADQQSAAVAQEQTEAALGRGLDALSNKTKTHKNTVDKAAEAYANLKNAQEGQLATLRGQLAGTDGYSEAQKALNVMLAGGTSEFRKMTTAKQADVIATQKQIVAMQLDVDKRNLQIASARQLADLDRQIAEEQADRARKNAAQVEGVGHGSEWNAERQAIDEVTDSTRKQIAAEDARYRQAIDNAKANGTIAAVQAQLDETHLQMLGKLQAAGVLDAKSTQDNFGAMKAAQADWSKGAQAALEDIQSSAADAAGAAKTLFTNSFNSAADALANFVTTGKGNFADLAQSILSDLVKIETRILLSQALTSMFGGGMGTAAGYNSATPQQQVAYDVSVSGGRRSGGPVAGGNLYEVAEGGAPELLTSSGRTYLMMGAQGGQVTPASAAWGGSGAGQPRGGALGGVQVEINITNNGQAVQATQTGSRMDGKKMMIDLILDTVSGDTAKGGRTALATQQRFGLQRRGVPVGA